MGVLHCSDTWHKGVTIMTVSMVASQLPEGKMEFHGHQALKGGVGGWNLPPRATSSMQTAYTLRALVSIKRDGNQADGGSRDPRR